ncbi:MAG: methyltransferase type 11 [Proteobacteria bacterium]|nr:methyltransferase type 11 [Pseudomonadota bacterium]
MHGSSMTNMKACIDRYLVPLALAHPTRKLRVVDIGAQDVNGSYKSLLDPASFDYLGIDMVAGNGVDLVINDPYRLPIADGFADCVMSGQMLEHNEFFWLSFAEKMRIVNDTGFVFMIAPSKGFIHRYPVDCYRFYPDAYTALAKYANAILIDCWLDTNSEWGDLVGVFIKSYRPGFRRFDTTTINA